VGGQYHALAGLAPEPVWILEKLLYLPGDKSQVIQPIM